MSNRGPDRETLGVLLRAGRDRLRDAGLESPEVEAELLMRQALRPLGAPLPGKAWLLPRLGGEADAAVRERFEALLRRRLAGEPSAYITGVREFYGLELEVTPDVLIPRPETELLVSKAVDWAYGSSPRPSPYPGPDEEMLRLMRRSLRTRDKGLCIVDVGTGSGAIAIALARSLPAATIIATDVSWPALDVARSNAARHGVLDRISLRHGALMEPVNCYVDLIVANLPYVSEDDWRTLAPEVRDHEPVLALTSGRDGLDLIRALLRQIPRYLRPVGAVCLEFGIGQGETLMGLVARLLPAARARLYDDFGGIPRVLVATLGEN